MKTSEFSWQVMRWIGILGLVLGILVRLSTPETTAQGNQQTHVVQTGENLFRIALQYGTTVDALAYANGISDPTTIYVGQVLSIPDPNSPVVNAAVSPSSSEGDISTTPAVDTSPPPTTAPIYHIVEAGQTLTSIADQYGTSLNEISEWNNITNPNHILLGQRLIVKYAAAPDSAAVAGPTIVDSPPAEASTESTSAGDPPPLLETYSIHIVQDGERLASIARDYGISWTTIARANSITNPNTIYAGQELKIPVQNEATGTYLEPTGGVPAAAAPTTNGSKRILVNLTEQKVYAYENDQLVKTVIVSTGLAYTPTVTGNYRVYWKLASQTMSGPGYYLPGVPYVMYFYQGYALHGTYWHNNFGQPMSHGCVNMPTTEAQWFFNWSEIGTPVTVTY
jgi:LysM repeat protein